MNNRNQISRFAYSDTRRIIAYAAAVVLFASSNLAKAQPAPAALEQGRVHFNHGVALFRESDFRGALVEFRRSYEVSHNYKVLYNVGQTELELQEYAAARESFQKYLAEGGAEIEPSRRASVAEELRQLESRIGQVEVTTNVAGAEVLVDDIVVGKTPLHTPVVVSIGRRKIALQKPGAAAVVRYVDLAGGDTIKVPLEIVDSPVSNNRSTSLADSGAMAPASRPSAPAGHTQSDFGTWLGVTITGGLTAGAVATGIAAMSAHKDAQNKLNTFGVKASDIDTARSNVNTLALAADVLGGGALVAAGVTIVVTVRSRSKQPAPRTEAFLTVGPRGVQLSGRF